MPHPPHKSKRPPFPQKGAGKTPERKRTGEKKINVNLFGLHAVCEAIENPARHIHALYYGTEKTKELCLAALERARKNGLTRPVPAPVDRSRLDAALEGQVHQGLAALVQPLAETFLQDVMIRAENNGDQRQILVILDQVTDPHNVGAIMRSACAFGAAGMIVQTRHAPEIEGIAAKTACGAAEHLPVVREVNLARAIETLKEHGWFVLGFDERGDATPDRLPGYEKCVLVLGAEGAGLRENIRAHCDRLVRLPTVPPIAALNVSNAAAVALYALSIKKM